MLLIVDLSTPEVSGIWYICFQSDKLLHLIQQIFINHIESSSEQLQKQIQEFFLINSRLSICLICDGAMKKHTSLDH